MKKFLSSLFIFILAVLVFAVVAKDWIIKTAIEQGVTRATGFSTQVDSVKFDFPSTIHIQGLNIDNPSGFKEKIFVNIPEIYASLVLDEILQGKRIHLPEVRLNLREIHIEKNEKGVSNVELLSSVGGQGAKQERKTLEKAEQKPPMPFLLEKLVLTLGTVSYSDRSSLLASSPLPAKVKVDLHVNEEVITNIQDAKALVNIILAKVLNGASLGNLLDLDAKALLNSSLSGVTDTGKQLIGKSSELVTKGLGDVTSQAKNLADQNEVTRKAEALLGGATSKTTDALGDAAGAAKSQVSGLFGKLKAPASAESSEKAETV